MAVATGDDLEQVARILTILRIELDQRRRLLADAHAESISAYRRQGSGQPLPRLVVLLDGYAGFHASFEAGPLYPWLSAFQRLVADGRQAGIHVVMTHPRPLGIPAALTSAMGARLVLRLSTADEMIGLGVARASALGAELAPGRGFLGARTEVQVAVAGHSDTGADQAAALTDLGDRLRADMEPAPPLPRAARAGGAGGLGAARRGTVARAARGRRPHAGTDRPRSAPRPRPRRGSAGSRAGRRRSRTSPAG